MKPLVTIAIPTYNRLAYLKEAVASALHQSYKNIEVLIGLDPTSQGPDLVIKEWLISLLEKNPTVKYFINEKNLGLAGNWNALLDKAKGECIIIIGDDDRLLPDAIEKLVSAILPDKSVAFSNHFLIDQNGNRLERESILNTEKFNRKNLAPGLLKNPAKIIWQNAVPVSAALLNTNDAKKIKFKEDLNTPEIELFLRLANSGGNFIFIPDYLAEYRVHPQSATHFGLKVHRLLKYLIPMEVSEENKRYKIDFIQGLIVSGVNIAIADNDMDTARTLFTSDYYPFKLKFQLKGIIQFVCIILPYKLSERVLRFFRKFK